MRRVNAEGKMDRKQKRKPTKENFTPNTPILFGKLKDHKNPMKL